MSLDLNCILLIIQYQTLRKNVTLKSKAYLALMCHAQGIAYLFGYIPKVDMKTNTLGL